MRFVLVPVFFACVACASRPEPVTSAARPADERPRVLQRTEVRRYESAPGDAGIENALHDFLDYLQDRVRPNGDEAVIIEIRGEPLVLSEPAVIDIEWGNGHAQTLTFLRIAVGAGAADLEQIQWVGRDLEHDSPRVRSVRRTTMALPELDRIVDLCRALPMVACRREEIGPAAVGPYGSSSDFFVLVRVSGSRGEPLLLREFCGYAGPDDWRYEPVRFVAEQAEAFAERLDSWTAVGAGEWRTCHFTDAFRRNRELMLQEYHWWVMERSVEMLGSFGNEEALDTVRFLRSNRTDELARIEEALDSALDAGNGLLVGPPKPPLPDSR